MHRSDSTFTSPAHKGHGEYIAMSFMCAGSHKYISSSQRIIIQSSSIREMSQYSRNSFIETIIRVR